jgi:hydroxymethylpyrimidine pyrophosphatase-like HAD family hydrolase
MGKNYESELALLESTASWTSKLDISRWEDAAAKLMGCDLIVIASGGSVAAAQLLAQLHASRTGRVALAMTPLEFMSETRPVDTAVWLISAGGSNSDILEAWHATVIRGVNDVAVLCAAPASPLAKLAEGAGALSVTFDPPAGNDGFLATNSLIAFCVVILRFYGIAPLAMPNRPRIGVTDDFLARPTLVILYGGWLKTVAVDMESRFTEAALCSIQIADYRNFAHGRHHWLAKRGDNTSVLALISPAFAELAGDTLAALPANVLVERWEFDVDSPAIALQGIQLAMELAGTAANRLGYDAGRPGVPDFGHRLYNLKAQPRTTVPTTRELAIARKIRASGTQIEQELERMDRGFCRFEESLHNATFSGVVLDYDGTIVATRRRFEDIDPSMASELNRLLDAGLVLGIATGRGKSVHEKLRAAIDRVHWAKCTIGYYNGSVIRSLADTCDGLADPISDAAISGAMNALQHAPELVNAKLDVRPQQISVTRSEFSKYGLWMKVRGILEKSALNTLKVVYSSHSVDVVPISVSKVNVVTHLANQAEAEEAAFLKIGDRGQWPGNDADLLALSHGLSVDEVSGNPDSCWNLASYGITGHAATLYYLKCVRARRYEPNSRN